MSLRPYPAALASTGLPESALAAIQQVLAAHPAVEQAILYGSRALGRHRPASDIDLTLLGPDLSSTVRARIDAELDDLLLPWVIDLSCPASLRHPALLDHIERIGLVLYERPRHGLAQPVTQAPPGPGRPTPSTDAAEPNAATIGLSRQKVSAIQCRKIRHSNAAHIDTPMQQKSFPDCCKRRRPWPPPAQLSPDPPDTNGTAAPGRRQSPAIAAALPPRTPWPPAPLAPAPAPGLGRR